MKTDFYDSALEEAASQLHGKVLCPLHTWIAFMTCHKKCWNSVSFSTSACRLHKEVEVYSSQLVDNWRT